MTYSNSNKMGINVIVIHEAIKCYNTSIKDNV